MRNLARGAPGAARPSRHRRDRASLPGALRAARSTCLRNERRRNFIWRSTHNWRASVPAPARPPAVRRALPGRLIAIASSDSAEFVDPLRDETLPAPDGEVFSYRGFDSCVPRSAASIFSRLRGVAHGQQQCAGFMTARGWEGSVLNRRRPKWSPSVRSHEISTATITRSDVGKSGRATRNAR